MTVKRTLTALLLAAGVAMTLAAPAHAILGKATPPQAILGKAILGKA